MSREGSWLQSTHPNAPVSVGARPSLDLVVVHPPEVAGLRFALAPGVVFGRAAEGDVASIPHPTISRRHAEVRAAMGGVLYLEDAGSRNGTKLDGAVPDAPVPLQPQAVVRLGDVHAVVCEPSVASFDAESALPGTNARLVRLRSQLEEAASSGGSVLVVGETGSGKERLAHEVHRLSGRNGRYVTLSCAELSPQLIESQLFGHERGAFTGASVAKSGLFAAAHGGTLFLDEIGELPLDLQPKLLRVLQEGELRRLGSVDVERVNVGVVAATNRDLRALVESGGFRRDLHARLAQHEIQLPPLRERREDLLSWLTLLTARHARARGVPLELGFAPDAVECLLLHRWDDNLRGLERVVHRLAGHTTLSRRVLLEALPELAGEAPRRPTSAPAAAGSAPPPRNPSTPPTREELLSVYTSSGNSVRATAKHFGKDRRQVYRWLERFGIPRSEDRSDDELE